MNASWGYVARLGPCSWRVLGPGAGPCTLDAVRCAWGDGRGVRVGSSGSALPSNVLVVSRDVPAQWLVPKCSLAVHSGARGTRVRGGEVGAKSHWAVIEDANGQSCVQQ